MDEDATNAQELFYDLRECARPDVHATVLVPWIDRAQGSYRSQLATCSLDQPWWPGESAARVGGRLLAEELYALNRVSDVLLLSFQPAHDATADQPWVHKLHPLDPWPAVSMGEYLDLFTSLGMTPGYDTAFDPFLHEIVEVEQDDDPSAPIQVEKVLWPSLMLGQMLFNRAGVRVRAGAQHAQRGVADRSPIYWTFLRRHRATVDLSHGWGHNSQWATDFRLDYRVAGSPRLNVSGYQDIDAPEDLTEEASLLTPGERRELMRHRYLLREPDAAVALSGLRQWQTEIWPFEWRLPEGEERSTS